MATNNNKANNNDFSTSSSHRCCAGVCAQMFGGGSWLRAYVRLVMHARAMMGWWFERSYLITTSLRPPIKTAHNLKTNKQSAAC